MLLTWLWVIKRLIEIIAKDSVRGLDARCPINVCILSCNLKFKVRVEPLLRKLPFLKLSRTDVLSFRLK